MRIRGAALGVVTYTVELQLEIMSEIPRQIHRIWWGPPMPLRYRWYGRQIRRLHPAWHVRDWRSPDELPTLINGDLIARAEEFYPHDAHRFRADLFRLEILYQYGGIYLDMDCVVRRSLEPVVARGGVFAGFNPKAQTVMNGVIGAPRGHPFIKACIDVAVDQAERNRGAPLHMSVGPALTTRIERSRAWPDVAIYPPGELYDCYLTHRWDGARRRRRARWKDKPLRAAAADLRQVYRRVRSTDG